MNRRLLLPALLPLVLSACTSIDFDYPKTESTYIKDTSDTYLAGEVASGIAGKPAGMSGFYGLDDGIDALAARVWLADQAERSIDVQYYLIKQDDVGTAFFAQLLEAADRGVRVRLLLDDMFTKGADKDLIALDSHPNFEIRIYNPFNRGLLGRNLGAAASFRRINRRMHNKSFTVDNQVTIIGGRNIADEYFGARPDAAFGDLDVIGLGPIVQDVSDMFDKYWAHRTAVPVAAFIKAPKDPEAALIELRGKYLKHQSKITKTKYAEALMARAYPEVEDDITVFDWAPYKLIYDTPDKGLKGKADPDELIIAALDESLSTLEKELLIVSPYFVPLKGFTNDLIELQESGVQIYVVTNSLAANNQKTVHGGYAPYRKPLLKAGIRLFEVRPDARVSGTEYIAGSASRSTLHTKSYLLDRREIFIGSFNFDPRSAYINTEMGVLIDDERLGAEYAREVDADLPSRVFEVTLNEKGKLRWSSLGDDGEVVTYTKEPMTNWWQRFMAGFYRILPIRSQL